MNNHPPLETTAPVVVIGAGPSGLAAVKNLLEQGSSQVIVFEKNNRLGGNWFFDEDNQHSSVYETTHLISSKRLSAFEDFPMPAEYPDYPSQAQMLRYFESYAAHFNLLPHLQFNTTVLKAEPLGPENLQWKITYQNSAGIQELICEALLVANGHHWDPRLPNYPGNFEGQILHSHAYKRAAPFKDQRVLVVGAGNSACDLAVEISRVAKKTCISIRQGQPIFPKFIFGKPTDQLFAIIEGLPNRLKQKLAAFTIRLVQGRYEKYQLQRPKVGPLALHPTINSELLYFIRHGKVHPKVGIKHFEGSSVHFQDGQVENFDSIIYATGYHLRFPFFDESLIDYREITQVPLYRKMTHPDFKRLFFIGLFQPQGCIWPLADFQAKIAAQQLKGTLQRPENLTECIEKEITEARLHYVECVRNAIEVDYHRFRRQLLAELTANA